MDGNYVPEFIHTIVYTELDSRVHTVISTVNYEKNYARMYTKANGRKIMDITNSDNYE